MSRPSHSPTTKIPGCSSPGEQIENVPVPLLPQLCSASLRKHGSFLSCGLGPVSALREVQRSPRAGLLTLHCPRKPSAAAYAMLGHPPQAVSQPAKGGTHTQADSDASSQKKEHRAALFCTSSRLQGERGVSGISLTSRERLPLSPL